MDKNIEEALIVAHPERLKIFMALKNAKEPLFINKLAKIINTDRKLVSYHLSTLEQHGFVESEFKVIKIPQSKGKAGRFYKLTKKADETIPKLIKYLQT